MKNTYETHDKTHIKTAQEKNIGKNIGKHIGKQHRGNTGTTHRTHTYEKQKNRKHI